MKTDRSATDEMILHTLKSVRWFCVLLPVLIIALLIVQAVRDRPCPSCAKCPTAERP